MRWVAVLLCWVFAGGVRAADFLYTPASAIQPALLDAAKQPHPEYVRYISLYNCQASNLPSMRAAVSFTINSLSRKHLLVPVVQVNERLARISLSDYGIEPSVFDALSERGSGQAPFPEPYFHDVRGKYDTQYQRVEVGGRWEPYPNGQYPGYTHYVKQYEQRAVGRAYQTHIDYNPIWLPTNELNQLYAITKSKFPILRADWFVNNALIEPRYHELLGVGNTLDDVLKVAIANRAQADKVGSQARGAVLFSEVATHNRLLERTPTIVRYGRGYFWQSNDYLSSVGAQDVLTDPLNNTPDAHELIWTLKNGMQGYFLTDGKGKRLDKAAADVASDKRSGFADPQVYSARNCIICHAKGIIPVEDEVREHAKDQVALSIRTMREKGHTRTAERISAKYFEVQINDLVSADQASYESAVKQLTGLASSSIALHINRILVHYNDAANTLDDLARDLGYPASTVKAVIERGNGLSHVYVGLARQNPRKARRDQIEATFAEIASAMAAVPVKVVK